MRQRQFPTDPVPARHGCRTVWNKGGEGGGGVIRAGQECSVGPVLIPTEGKTEA